MGYLITSHIIKGNADISRLRSLPEELSVKVYETQNKDGLLLDIIATGKSPDYPFQRLVSSSSIALELPEKYNELNLLYNKLKKARVANSFKRALVNLNIELSSTLEKEVLSFVSDDDQLDFSVVSNNGNIERLHFLADDIEIIFQKNIIEIQPLETEEGVPLIELSIFDDTPFKVKENFREYPTLLHFVAANEVNSFLKGVSSAIGLSEFDPELFSLRELPGIERKQNKKVSNDSQITATNPWWKFWKW